MKKIGITGGIGVGKTFVTRIFQSMGIPVYNADVRAKWLLQNDSKLREAIELAFGKKTYLGGELNRPYLAKIVFNDSVKLAQLNRIVHPAVGKDGNRWVKEKMRENRFPYIIKEAALLFETNSYQHLDKIICVTASDELRIQRAMQRDGAQQSDIEARMKQQMPQERKEKMANFVIFNDNEQALLPQIWKIHQRILAEK